MNEEDNKLPCDEKMVFETQDEAENLAVAVDWQRGTQLRAYRCRYCHLWHLTSA